MLRGSLPYPSIQRIVPIILLMLSVHPTLSAGVFEVANLGCFLDLPTGWESVGSTPDGEVFSVGGGVGYLQLKTFQLDRFAGVDSLRRWVDSSTGNTEEGDSFTFGRYEAYFTSVKFVQDGVGYQGFGFYMEGELRDWVLLSVVETNHIGRYHFELLSALDSFARDRAALLLPGPVSSYYESSFEDPDMVEVVLPFRAWSESPSEGSTTDGSLEGAILHLRTTTAAVEATQVTLEREAQVLGYTQQGDDDGWARFYRVLYRDNFSRLDSLIEQMEESGLSASTDRVTVAKALLAWIQGFEYRRSGTLEDFFTPLAVLDKHAGDCDSLGLLYVILLKSLGIDAILMVSSHYSHAMAGIELPGEGARFQWGTSEWLVAELTDRIDLGKIAADMADPAHWLGIIFPP